MDPAGYTFFEVDEIEEAEFPLKLEREAFPFRHRLSRSPLLQMDALRALSGYFQANDLPCHFEQGQARARDGWGSLPAGATLLDVFSDLKCGNALIMLKSVHRHPDYNTLLSDFLAEVGRLMHVDMSRHYRVPICTIIIASPHRITPYHMDDAHNLLMQVHGQKTFYVFDGTDADIVSAAEREKFWAGNFNAAEYTDARQAKAFTFDLGPGIGVHVPVTYPHWASNGSDVSVALSINFQPLRNVDAEILALNARLRRLGLNPKAPGRNRLVDLSKSAAFRTLSSMKRALAHAPRPAGT